MDMVLITIGKFLDLLREATGSYLLAALGVAVFIKLLLLLSTNRFYMNLKKYSYFQSVVEAVRKDCKKNGKPVNKEIANALMKNKYQIWGFTGACLIGTFIAALIALPILIKPEILAVPELLTAFNGALNLGESPLKIWLSIPDNAPFISLSLVLIPVALQSFHTTCTNRYLIIEQQNMDLILIFGVAMLAAFLPGIFSVVWIGVKVLDFLHYGIVMKLVK